MYNKTDKRRLYWLVDQYLSNKIDERTFCNEFHDSFVNEMDYGILTDIEFDTFSDLSDVSQRFSEHEEDLKLWEGFVGVEQLIQEIIKTKEKLRIELLM